MIKESKKKNYDSKYLKEQFKSGKLILDPEYQRFSVWSKKDKVKFIDSLLRGIDVPKIYLRRAQKAWETVDGQQRLRALFDYIDSEFSLSGCEPVDGRDINKTYSDLDLDFSEIISDYVFDVVQLKGYSDEEISDYFSRLQRGSRLNAPEKRRSIISNMRIIAKKLSEHNFFKVLRGTNKRCAYEDFVGKAYHLIKYDCKSNPNIAAIDRNWWVDKDIDLCKDKTVKKIISIFDFIYSSLNSFAGDSCKNPFGNYFLISLVKVVYDLYDTTTIKRFEKEFGKCIIDFSTAREEARSIIKNGGECEKIFGQYEAVARSDSLNAIKNRTDIIIRYMKDKIPYVEKDPRRFFSQAQKAKLYGEANGTCKCGYMGSSDDFNADHITPWDAGGLTVIENGQLLCIDCNSKKSNKVIEDNDKEITVLVDEVPGTINMSVLT